MNENGHSTAEKQVADHESVVEQSADSPSVDDQSVDEQSGGPQPGGPESDDQQRGVAEPVAAVDETDSEEDVSAAAAQSAVELGPGGLAAALEAILFVVEAPVAVAALASALQQPTAEVERALEQLRTGYDDRQAGIEVREVAGGVRIYTRPANSAQVEMFLQDGQRSRLTQAALETLAVVAYRQPVTRARVSAIRGVNVDGVVRTLLTRGLIVEVGSDPETGGGLYRTTELFLEKMGLQSLAELPSLAPLLPELSGLESDEL